jgi:phage terminase Nu1 subunit (DNA packaging protein)
MRSKNGTLGAEQLQTCRNRQTATEITRGRQRDITEAETRLTVAQADMQAIDKAVADINRRAAKRVAIAP